MRLTASLPCLALLVGIGHSAVCAAPSPTDLATRTRSDRFRGLHGVSTEVPTEASSQGAWYGFRNGFQNRGVSHVNVRPYFEQGSSRQPWAFETGGVIWGTPVIDDEGTVYLGSADKVFYALSSSGSLLWSYTLPDAGDALVDSAATLAPNSLVVVPGGDGALHALDRTTGALKWKFDAYHADDHESGVTVNSFEGNVTLGPDGNLYAGSDNGHMYSLDINGQERWNFETGMMIWSAPAFAPDGSWMAFGSLDTKLYVLDPATGQKIASYKGGADFKGSPVVDEQGRIYIGCADFSVYALEVTKGWFGRTVVKRRWKFATNGELYSSPAYADGKLLIGSHDGFLYCLNTEGEVIWKYGAHARISGSPAVSADGVVFVGAKNGKIYAIDLESGERIWSFKAAPGLRKVNLDSSPAISGDGRIVLGSYNGNIYGVPVEYAPHNAGDSRVSLDPGNDIPNFGGELPVDGATLRYVDRTGNFHVQPEESVNPESMLTFRLVDMHEGQFIPNAGIAVSGLEVTVTPETEVEVLVSSDSYLVNVFPKKFWNPDTTYTIEIKGRRFLRGNPFVDLVRWWNLRAFTYQGTFQVKPVQGDFVRNNGELPKYGIKKLYAAQPEQLDTLIPAAMDGQAFIAKAAFRNDETGALGLVVLPAYPRPEGVVMRTAPEKVFTMSGHSMGDSVVMAGPIKLAAMGAVIPLDPIRFFGRMTPDEILDGGFHGTAPVWGIKGNGSTYTGLSWSAIDDLADAWFKLQAMGTLKGFRMDDIASPVTLVGSQWTSSSEISLDLQRVSPVEGEHLITVVFWDAAKGEVVGHSSVLLDGAESGDTITLGGLSRRKLNREGIQMRVLFDAETVPTQNQ